MNTPPYSVRLYASSFSRAHKLSLQLSINITQNRQIKQNRSTEKCDPRRDEGGRGYCHIDARRGRTGGRESETQSGVSYKMSLLEVKTIDV